MTQKFYSAVIWIGLLMTTYLGHSQSNSSEERIDGYCDHIVVTIPGVHFDSLMKTLKSNIPRSLAIMPDNSKAFLIPSKSIPYVEFWNSSTSLYTGSQIALGSKEKEAIPKAQRYYGHKGTAYGELLTVGTEFASGHPYGGNFFVSYGQIGMSNPNDSVEVVRLKETRTLTPKTKTSIKDDYSFFRIRIEEYPDSFIATDTNGTLINTKFVESTPEAILGRGMGHVSLEFELAKAIYQERKEFKIGDDLKIIFDGNILIIILLQSQYEKF
ncbi:hypothetical protein [Winogradskyella aurantia]|uniref:Uncharacterized protein n=1 Tax=Winogradskyella aurantia TaxID=1915063 RepID=A0A265UXP7_9FLAO|nr:hypothetical protein [Winogradskyella aurantia]OZV70098.1 hypothetical protein CA834_05625 [Winogradskyella aurantia]